MGWVVNAPLRPIYLWKKGTAPIVQEAVWAPGPVWMRTKHLAPPGFEVAA